MIGLWCWRWCWWTSCKLDCAKKLGHKEVLPSSLKNLGLLRCATTALIHDHKNMSTEIPNFTGCADEVREIFKAYSSYDDRTEHDNALKAEPKIERIIRSIGAQVTQQTPFEAKQQGLSAAIDIAKVIIQEGDRSIIGGDIRKDLPWLPMSSTISHILDMLSPEELAALQADGETPKAIHHLRLYAREYALDLQIDDSIDRLLLEESDQEDDAHMDL